MEASLKENISAPKTRMKARMGERVPIGLWRLYRGSQCRRDKDDRTRVNVVYHPLTAARDALSTSGAIVALDGFKDRSKK